MSRRPVISVRGLSKSYNIYDRPRDILLEAVVGGARHDVFWALRDLDLDVFEGQRVGFVGPNGAGKSTLLKIVSGNLAPTSGSVQVEGRVSAMLSLTSFLDPAQTGLDNIRFNLIVNGADRSELPRLTEEIVDFTELGAFIKAPVRTYSSGMNARLAFAISTAISPDILIVDEVLGAGDAYFANKATARMLALCEQGRALLFVSHAMSAVQLMCDIAVWMDNGQIRDIGPVDEIARRYEADFRRQEDEHLRAGNASRAVSFTSTVVPQEVDRRDLWRFRLTGSGGRVHDTHYVRKIEVASADDRRVVPLEFADIDDPEVSACLDVVNSEWARLHDRKGSRTRALGPGSSQLRGGHILVRAQAEDEETTELEFRVESMSLGGTEALVLQVADAQAGEWLDLEHVETVRAGDWTTSTFRARVVQPEDAAHEAQLARLTALTRPPAEVVGARLLVDGVEALAVREHQPFAVEVDLHASRTLPVADVWIQFIRSDGVYVFWQSSGQVEGGNIEEVEGDYVVRFEFSPNVFGAGDYDVEVGIGNGFDMEQNWPQSEVYDRHVGILRFTVSREWRLLMVGPVNVQFPVEIRRRELDRTTETESAQPTAAASES